MVDRLLMAGGTGRAIEGRVKVRGRDEWEAAVPSCAWSQWLDWSLSALGGSGVLDMQ